MTDAGILQERHPHGKILFLSYLVFSLIAFFCAVAGIFICRSAAPFGAWLFWFCVVSALSGRIFEKEIRKYVLLSYSIFSILGMMALFTYYFTYGYTFAPYGDDSYFFCNAQNIISGIENEKFEVYGVLISIPLRLIQLFADKFQHYALLPLNWAAASFVVGFSLRLGYDLLPGRECSPVPFLAFACIVLNSIFCDAVVHLYRDVFMSLFAVLSLHSVFRNRWKSSVVFAVFIEGPAEIRRYEEIDFFSYNPFRQCGSPFHSQSCFIKYEFIPAGVGGEDLDSGNSPEPGGKFYLLLRKCGDSGSPSAKQFRSVFVFFSLFACPGDFLGA